MRMQDRLLALIENAHLELDTINSRIDELLRELEKWRTRRLEIEEEAVEARVALSILQSHQLKVERNAEGVVAVSVDPKSEPSE